jgi:hypothetical protein
LLLIYQVDETEARWNCVLLSVVVVVLHWLVRMVWLILVVLFAFGLWVPELVYESVEVSVENLVYGLALQRFLCACHLLIFHVCRGNVHVLYDDSDDDDDSARPPFLVVVVHVALFFFLCSDYAFSYVDENWIAADVLSFYAFPFLFLEHGPCQVDYVANIFLSKIHVVVDVFADVSNI